MGKQRRGFFCMLENRIVDEWIRDIGPGAFAVYALVLRRYNAKVHCTRYQSHQGMAETLGMTVNTLEKHLGVLLDVGLVEREPHPQGKARRHPMWLYGPVLPVPGRKG